MSKMAAKVIGTLLLLFAAAHFLTAVPTVNAQANVEALSLAVYLDGFVMVNYQLKLNQTYPAISVRLIGETYEEMLVVDEQNLPLDYTITNNEALIYSLDTTEIAVSYFTQDLTAKTGKYWTLTANTPTNATVTLPATASIISINNVPELIQTVDSQVVLVMPAGVVEITYFTEHSLEPQTEKTDTMSLIITALLLSTALPIAASVIWLLKRRKPPLVPTETKSEVDTKKLFEKHKDLRQEEIQVISFLAERHGTAFEAELYEQLNLPRTTTWRLLKRLQAMGIVDITKTRRQNSVTIRKKFLKK
ncbi:MAG: hypothetical protein NWE94_01975 [Candidatus Bathyarchaeota archaeon]|nr:hypothetical protein [Candidatus Bathyarchaeota archaeon]